jgi:hypothetical protein
MTNDLGHLEWREKEKRKEKRSGEQHTCLQNPYNPPPKK